MTREEEAAMLAECRSALAAASTDWQLDINIVKARLIPVHEPTPVVVTDPWADSKDIAFILGAHRRETFLLMLIDRAIARYRRDNPPVKPPKDMARECGMYCAKPAFQRFLHEVHALDHPWDTNRSATKVRFLLDLKSRTELNDNPDAAQRWTKLRQDFYDWMKR